MSEEPSYPTRAEAILTASVALGSANIGLSGVDAAVSPLDALSIELHVNGTRKSVSIDPRATVLDTLREHLSLTGSKKGCDHGQCGACTIHIDGQRVLSCLTLALQAQGKTIVTIEGIARHDGILHPMQQAFLDNDALQCGYCTSGQIMSAIACVREKHTGSPEEIREYMSGNLCRCGAYAGIAAAVERVAGGGAA
jgi:xanthine dehydrogenase YagT iron-sulfur-binding subunit